MHFFSRAGSCYKHPRFVIIAVGALLVAPVTVVASTIGFGGLETKRYKGELMPEQAITGTNLHFDISSVQWKKQDQTPQLRDNTMEQLEKAISKGIRGGDTKYLTAYISQSISYSTAWWSHDTDAGRFSDRYGTHPLWTFEYIKGSLDQDLRWHDLQEILSAFTKSYRYYSQKNAEVGGSIVEIQGFLKTPSHREISSGLLRLQYLPGGTWYDEATREKYRKQFGLPEDLEEHLQKLENLEN